MAGEVVEERGGTCKVRLDTSFHGINDLVFNKHSHDLQLIEVELEFYWGVVGMVGAEVFG